LDAAQEARLGRASELYDWIVFTSPNAVEYFLGQFFRLHRDVRELGTIRLAALGPATAALLTSLHLSVDVQPKTYTAEKLAEAFPGEILAGKRVLVPHGWLADPTLVATLQAAGAQVDEWIVYDTRPETADPAGARARYEKEGAHFIAFTSASTVENWHALALQPAPGAPRPGNISMGPVPSEALRRLGCGIAAEAPEATLDSLVETIRKLSIESSYADNR
jgi:uroporphyrinogen III methyltransferase/synthase